MHLQFRRFDLKLAHTWRIARGVGGPGTRDFPVMLVELEDTEGRRGVGESAPSQRYDETVDTVEAFLRKVDAARLSFADVPGSMAYLDQVRTRETRRRKLRSISHCSTVRPARRGNPSTICSSWASPRNAM
jgi:L-alanine-DL-glutamate epimerase-like enolase superfamily enzyme